MRQAKEKEKEFGDNLSAFVAEKVCDKFGVPDDTIDFTFNLVDGIDQSKTTVPFGPDESTPSDTFSTFDPMYLEEEVSKRKTINILVAGAADYYTRKILDESIGELDNFSVSLHSLYKNYLNACQYNLFAPDREKLNQKDKKLTGISIVKLGNEERKNMVIADGVITPILLYEAIKGFFDMFAAHGLPEDRSLEAVVISKCDYISAEPWYMRLGPELFGRLMDCMPEREGSLDRQMPYIFMKMCCVSAEKFNNLMSEVFEGTSAARRVMERLVEYADRCIEREKLEPKLASSINYDSGTITDQFIEATEL